MAELGRSRKGPSANQVAAADGGSRRTTGKKAPGGGRARSSSGGRDRGRPGRIDKVSISPDAEALFGGAAAVERVVTALGSNVVAGLLGVSTSQPSRWRAGTERIAPRNRKAISDLDHVLDRLLLELHPEQAGLWLTGPNPHLGGARPIDALELRGAAPVLGAIDALAAGAFS